MLPSEDGDLETQGPGWGLESQWRRVHGRQFVFYFKSSGSDLYFWKEELGRKKSVCGWRDSSVGKALAG